MIDFKEKTTMPEGSTISRSDSPLQAGPLENLLSQMEDGQQPGQDRDRPPVIEATISDWIVPVLAFILTAGFFALLFVLCFHTVPNPNLAMLNIVLGSLGTAWIGAMAYFFGSSSGNQAKDWMLYRSQPLDQQPRR
jgi:hypothetical protein